MRLAIGLIGFSCFAAQAADWPTVSGSPQRDGWAKSETAFTKENVKGLELLYQFKAEGNLSTPMIDTRIITYLGFKEMLVFASSSGDVYSVDADLNRLIWKVRLAGGDTACGGLNAPVAMAGSSTAIVARGPAVRPPVVNPPANVVRRPANRSGEFYAIGADGALHVLNTSTGADRAAAIPFVPAGSKVSALNVSDGVVYAATLEDCGGHKDALYAVDLADGKVVSQPAQDGHLSASGTAIGSDGVVYTQATDLHGAAGDAVVALKPKTLEISDYFMHARSAAGHRGSGSPVVFSWQGSDRVVAAGADGTVYLLDAKSLGGPEHNTVLFASEPGVGGSLGSWEDPASKDRWVYASGANGVVGFKAGERALEKVWTSAGIAQASAPAIANGVVFVRGEKGFFALDGATGKTLFSTPVPNSAAGIVIANRRIYVAAPGAVYCFGFVAEQPQLTGK